MVQKENGLYGKIFWVGLKVLLKVFLGLIKKGTVEKTHKVETSMAQTKLEARY